MVTGYVIMRMAMVGLWLRAAVSDAAGRQTALRYAAGITVVQAGWLAWFFFVPPGPRRLGLPGAGGGRVVGTGIC